MNTPITAALAAVGAAVVVVGGMLLAVTERPPIDGIQRGFRGSGLVQLYNPRFLAQKEAENVIPVSLPRLPAAGAKAGVVYKNVQVLKDVSVGNFTRLMASMSNWVAPQVGCAYCHDVNNMASDALYTKVVARRMIQMVQHINSDWKSHVAETGVVCYTCHRGNPVPQNIWFADPGPEGTPGYTPAVGKNHPATVAGITALPLDPFTPFLLGDQNIRVQPSEALPGTGQQFDQADRVDLLSDDELLPVSGGELRLLP